MEIEQAYDISKPHRDGWGFSFGEIKGSITDGNGSRDKNPCQESLAIRLLRKDGG